MNKLILLPRRTRKNPGWLLRLARWIGTQRQFLCDYKKFRLRGFTHRAAWFNAANVLKPPPR